MSCPHKSALWYFRPCPDNTEEAELCVSIDNELTVLTASKSALLTQMKTMMELLPDDGFCECP